jgi:hypothetical protein
VLGGLAFKKANDVEWVRAAFGGDWRGFEPYVRLWIRNGKDATGLIILMHDYPKESDTESLPDVCVRWSEWHEPLAAQGFASADNKRLYVQNDLPIHCSLRFYRSAEIGIGQLMERTSKILAGGISFNVTDRTDCREVTVEFCDGSLSYEFSFFPGGFSSVLLEEITREWFEYAQSLQMQHDYPPDEGFQIAYRESLWEQIARYEKS